MLRRYEVKASGPRCLTNLCPGDVFSGSSICASAWFAGKLVLRLAFFTECKNKDWFLPNLRM
jgi:hypothetical protein